MGLFGFLKKKSPEADFDMPPMPPPMNLEDNQKMAAMPEPNLPFLPGAKDKRPDNFPDFKFDEPSPPQMFQRFEEPAPPAIPNGSIEKKIPSFLKQETKQPKPAINTPRPIREIDEEVQAPPVFPVPGTLVSQDEANKGKFNNEVFVKLHDFKEILRNIDFIKKNTRKLDDVFKNIHDIDQKSNNHFDKYRNNVDMIAKSIKSLDNKLFG